MHSCFKNINPYYLLQERSADFSFSYVWFFSFLCVLNFFKETPRQARDDKKGFQVKPEMTETVNKK